MSEQTARIVFTLTDRVSRNLDAIRARFNRVDKAASSFGESLSGFGAAVKTSGKILAGIIATAGGMVMLAKTANESARKVADMAGRYQVSARTLQMAGEMAATSGASFEDAASSIGRLKKSQNEAIHGNKELAAAFKGVGISVDSLKKMTPEEILLHMADAFKGSENDLAKQAVLLKVMGKNGEAMMNALNEGGDAWRQKLKEMIEDGAFFTDEQLKESEAFDNSWNRIANTFKGLKNSLGISLAKAILPVIDQLREWVNANRDLIQSKFQTFLKHLPSLIESVTKVLTVVWRATEKAGALFEWIGHLVGMQGATWITFAAIIAKPVWMFGKLTLGILSLGREFARFLPSLKTVKNVFAWLGRGAFLLGKILWGVLLPSLKLVGKTVLWLGRALLMNPIGLAVTAIAGAAYLIYRYWEPIKGFFSGLWGRVQSVFEGGIGSITKAILDWSPLGLFYKAFAGVLRFFDIELPESFSAFGSKMIDKLFSGITERFQAGKNLIAGIGNKLSGFFGAGGDKGEAAAPSGGSHAATLIAGAASKNKQDITNTLNIKIDSEGRPTVTTMKAGSADTKINVNTGLLMAGT